MPSFNIAPTWLHGFVKITANMRKRYLHIAPQVFQHYFNHHQHMLQPARHGDSWQRPGHLCDAEGEGDHDQAICIIRDHGPGIEEAIQSQIFESFLTNRPGGTGLGLSISKRILRDHHGNIELVESSSKGSTFRFWLPAHQ